MTLEDKNEGLAIQLIKNFKMTPNYFTDFNKVLFNFLNLVGWEPIEFFYKNEFDRIGEIHDQDIGHRFE